LFVKSITFGGRPQHGGPERSTSGIAMQMNGTGFVMMITTVEVSDE